MFLELIGGFDGIMTTSLLVVLLFKKRPINVATRAIKTSRILRLPQQVYIKSSGESRWVHDIVLGKALLTNDSSPEHHTKWPTISDIKMVTLEKLLEDYIITNDEGRELIIEEFEAQKIKLEIAGWKIEKG